MAILLSGCGLARQAEQRAQSEAHAAKLKEALEKDAAVMDECKEKRLRKELKGWVATVNCSNPRIYEIWREYGDPPPRCPHHQGVGPCPERHARPVNLCNPAGKAGAPITSAGASPATLRLGRECSVDQSQQKDVLARLAGVWPSALTAAWRLSV
jgi:hypothetical protein